MKFLSSLAVHMLARRRWDYGLPECLPDSNDKAIVQAVLDGLESIEAHRQRLGQPSSDGKHAATTAEEGRS